MQLLNKKGQGDMQGFILSIVGVAVVLAVGLIVLSNLQTATYTAKASCGQNSTGGSAGIVYTNCGSAYNATGAIVTKLATVPVWIGIIITVALAFIVLGYFYSR